MFGNDFRQLHGMVCLLVYTGISLLYYGHLITIHPSIRMHKGMHGECVLHNNSNSREKFMAVDMDTHAKLWSNSHARMLYYHYNVVYMYMDTYTQ